MEIMEIIKKYEFIIWCIFLYFLIILIYYIIKININNIKIFKKYLWLWRIIVKYLSFVYIKIYFFKNKLNIYIDIQIFKIKNKDMYLEYAI